MEHHARVTSAVSYKAEEAQPMGKSIARRVAEGAVFPGGAGRARRADLWADDAARGYQRSDRAEEARPHGNMELTTLPEGLWVLAATTRLNLL